MNFLEAVSLMKQGKKVNIKGNERDQYLSINGLSGEGIIFLTTITTITTDECKRIIKESETPGLTANQILADDWIEVDA